jgi:hypothetical protein
MMTPVPHLPERTRPNLGEEPRGSRLVAQAELRRLPGTEGVAIMAKGKSRTRSIPARPGKSAISFQEGGLHRSTGTKPGQKISAAKHRAARAGKLGPKAKRQEEFFENVLRKGRGKKRGG